MAPLNIRARSDDGFFGFNCKKQDQLVEEEVLPMVKDAVLKAVWGLNSTGLDGSVSESWAAAQIEEVFGQVEAERKELELKFVGALFPTFWVAEARAEACAVGAVDMVDKVSSSKRKHRQKALKKKSISDMISGEVAVCGDLRHALRMPSSSSKKVAVVSCR